MAALGAVRPQNRDDHSECDSALGTHNICHFCLLGQNTHRSPPKFTGEGHKPSPWEECQELTDVFQTHSKNSVKEFYNQEEQRNRAPTGEKCGLGESVLFQMEGGPSMFVMYAVCVSWMDIRWHIHVDGKSPDG